MPYIPQFSKLSLQEMSYAPTLMRQQHDDAVAKQMELAEALKFDYLKQDAEGIEPILQKYNTDIDDVSKQIAQQGFSHDLKNKVMGLRSKYIGDDKIRHYKKQYSDAMSQWDETRKRMIQEGRPGDDINRQKEQFFSAYSGGYDPDGKFKNEFAPGRTSGYYDIAEDASKLMSNLGINEQPIIGSAASIQKVVDKDGSSYFKVTDSKNGSITTNKDQVSAIKDYLKAEYGDEKTDRGLFAKISKYDKPYIDSIVENIARAKTSYGKTAPQLDVNYAGFSDGSGSGSSSGYGVIDRTGFALLPKTIEALESEPYRDMADKLALDEARKEGLDVTSFKELKQLAAKADAKAIENDPSGFGFVRNDDPKSIKARKVVSNIEDRLGKETDPTMPTFNINRIAIGSGKVVNEINTLKGALNTTVDDFRDSFSGITKDDKKNLDKIVKNLEVTDFVINPKKDKAGLILYVKGVDDKDKDVKSAIYLNTKELDKEYIIYKYLGQLDPDILEYYNTIKTQ